MECCDNGQSAMDMTLFSRTLNKYLINLRYAFVISKPLLIVRLISNYLKIIFLKRSLLRYVDLAIDYRCNLTCEHCFAVGLEEKGRVLIKPDEFKRTVKEAMGLGAVNFSFQGGEPLMFEKLFDYIKAAHPSRNLISVTTNGVLLEERIIKRLKNSGVDILTVSLDSGIPEEHDSFRGMKGAFEKALEGVKLALKYGMKVTIGATITHESVHSEGFKRLLRLANELNVIILIMLPVALGRWSDNKGLEIDAEDKRYLEKLLKANPLLRTDFDANYIEYGCGALKEIIYITPYGDVLACPFLHSFLGNVREDSLKDIRERSLPNSLVKDYNKFCIAAEGKHEI